MSGGGESKAERQRREREEAKRRTGTAGGESAGNGDTVPRRQRFEGPGTDWDVISSHVNVSYFKYRVGIILARIIIFILIILGIHYLGHYFFPDFFGEVERRLFPGLFFWE